MNKVQAVPLFLDPQFRMKLPGDGYVVVAFNGEMTAKDIDTLIDVLKVQADVLRDEPPEAPTTTTGDAG